MAAFFYSVQRSRHREWEEEREREIGNWEYRDGSQNPKGVRKMEEWVKS